MTYEEYKKLKDKRDLENKKQLAEIEQRRAEANKIDEERLKNIIKPIIPQESYFNKPAIKEGPLVSPTPKKQQEEPLKPTAPKKEQDFSNLNWAQRLSLKGAKWVSGIGADSKANKIKKEEPLVNKTENFLLQGAINRKAGIQDTLGVATNKQKEYLALNKEDKYKQDKAILNQYKPKMINLLDAISKNETDQSLKGIPYTKEKAESQRRQLAEYERIVEMYTFETVKEQEYWANRLRQGYEQIKNGLGRLDISFDLNRPMRSDKFLVEQTRTYQENPELFEKYEAEQKETEYEKEIRKRKSMDRSTVADINVMAIMEEAQKEGEIKRLFGDALASSVNMVPSIAVGYFNPWVGASMLGVGAFGNARMDALKSGATDDEAMIYAVTIGVSETMLQRLFLGSVSKLIPRGGAGPLINQATQNTTKNLLTLLKQLSKTAGAEALEEGLQVPVEKLARKFTFDETVTMADVFDVEEILYNALVGAIVGVGFAGGPAGLTALEMKKAQAYIRSDLMPTINSGMALPVGYQGRSEVEGMIESIMSEKTDRITFERLKIVQDQIARDYQLYVQRELKSVADADLKAKQDALREAHRQRNTRTELPQNPSGVNVNMDNFPQQQDSFKARRDMEERLRNIPREEALLAEEPLVEATEQPLNINSNRTMSSERKIKSNERELFPDLFEGIYEPSRDRAEERVEKRKGKFDINRKTTYVPPEKTTKIDTAITIENTKNESKSIRQIDTFTRTELDDYFNERDSEKDTRPQKEIVDEKTTQEKDNYFDKLVTNYRDRATRDNLERSLQKELDPKKKAEIQRKLKEVNAKIDRFRNRMINIINDNRKEQGLEPFDEREMNIEAIKKAQQPEEVKPKPSKTNLEPQRQDTDQDTVQDIPQDTTQDETPKPVEPEPKVEDSNIKVGRKGNASYKKWISNEWVNLVNRPKTDTEVQSFDRFFKKWYDAGREGIRPIDVKQNTDDFNFPAFLQTEFYQAGKLDSEVKPKKETEPSVETKPAGLTDNESTAEQKDNADKLVDKILNEYLDKGEQLTNDQLFKMAREIYGDKFDTKQASDIMEVAVNRKILTMQFTENPIENIKMLVNFLAKLPTQGNIRSKEMLDYQQFSTPPNISYVVNWIANITNNDVVLEPSAGVGGIAIFGKKQGATVYVNELSDRRLELIKKLPFDGFFNENAEQINNILPQNVKPTVVVMNPPFSTSVGRTIKSTSKNATLHLEQALKRLEPNGRLVAIVGNSMNDTAPMFRDWWNKIKKEYNVRANIRIDGSNYRKYGTTYDAQILVIDKTGPTTEVITGSFKNLEDIIPRLEGVKNDRRIETSIKTEPETTIQGSGQTVGGRTKGGTTSNGTNNGSTTGTTQAGAPSSRPNRGSNTTRVDTNETTDSVPSNDTTIQNGGIDGGTETIQNQTIETTNDTGVRDRESDGKSNRIDTGLERDKNKTKATEKEIAENTDDIYSLYQSKKINIKGSQRHPAPLVESSAMGAVDLPDIDYIPNLPQELITSGELSDIQLEFISYAGFIHSQTLPDNTRRAIFNGDGTGVGKGRQMAGVILDNFRQGRTKAVWVSEKKGLFNDAVRDWTALKQDPKLLLNIDKVKGNERISLGKGVLFTTYDTLKRGSTANGPMVQTNSDSRLNQLVNWLGKDFDGVLIFDEAHNMSNALGIKPSAKALVGIKLQEMLPNARIVYASATGSTEISNLAYAPRLGLWGEGTGFKNVSEFIDKISSGGLGAMELVARDMKAMGLYLARSISYKGVEYETTTHKITPIQKEIYNSLARSWQMIIERTESAMIETMQGKNANQRGRILSAIFSNQQRFFNQILTSMSAPTLVNDIEKQLNDGKSVVLQLVQTGESAQTRSVADAIENDIELDDLEISPKQLLLDYLKKTFPVQQLEEVEVKTFDNFGRPTIKKEYRPVYDSEGNPVYNQEMLRVRNELIEDVEQLKTPDSIMDIILNEFGVDKVAEITGRKKRLIKDSRTGKMIYESRSSTYKDSEEKAFQGGRKRILIFSDAGGTGKSYHASITDKNQEQRVHYLVQAGWSAPQAMQGFGRTHRSAQVSAPIYKLVTTDIKGQKRFISTIAKRLDQMGALTKGQREASGGVFSGSDNLEGVVARQSLSELYRNLFDGIYSDIDGKAVLKRMNVISKLTNKDGGWDPNIEFMYKTDTFMNRLLMLEVDEQNNVLDEFMRLIDERTAILEEAGLLDKGLQNYKAEKIEIISEKVIAKNNNAETKYVQVKAWQKTNVAEYSKLESYKDDFMGVYEIENQVGGKELRAVYKGTPKTKRDGSIVDTFVLLSPSRGRQNWNADTLEAKSSKVNKKDAKQLWDKAVSELPKLQEETLHMFTGALLPVWDKLPSHQSRVYKVPLGNDNYLLGRIIDEADIDEVLRRFNSTREKPTVKVGDAYTSVLAKGQTIRLENNLTLKRSLVAGQNRIEIEGDNLRFISRAYPQILIETIQSKVRYFMPLSEATARDIIDKIIADNPISKVEGKQPNSYSSISRGDTTETSTERGNNSTRTNEEVATNTNRLQANYRKSKDGFLDEPIRRSEVEKLLSEFLEIPISQGKDASIRSRALGIFKPFSKTIRLRNTKDIKVLFHEVGHFLDDKLKIRNQAYVSELLRLGQRTILPSYSLDTQMAEGVAEFYRMYLTKSNDYKAIAPKFTEYFERILDANSDIAWMTDLLRTVTYNYYAQSPRNRVLGNISITPERQTLELGEKAERFYTLFVDDVIAFKRVVKAITKGVVVPIVDNAYEMVSHYRGRATGRVRSFIEFGVLNEEGAKISKGLMEILEPVRDKIDDFRVYIVSMRALELHKRRIETGLELQDLRDNVRKFGNEQFMKTFKELMEYQDYLLLELVRSGILSKNGVKTMKEMNQFYIPFYRVMKNQKSKRGQGYESYDPLTNIKGSTRDIIDPIASIIKNTYLFIDLAERNKIGTAFLNLTENFEGTGKFLEEIDPDVKGTSFNLKEIRKTLADILEGTDVNINELDLDVIETIFRSVKPRGDLNVITVYKNGKPRYFQVHDQAMFRAFSQLGKWRTGPWMKVLMAPSRLLRAGAINDPNFIVRNPIRDTLEASIFSENGFRVGLDTFGYVAEAFNKRELYYKWLNSGAAMADSQSVDRLGVHMKVDEVLGIGLKKKYINPINVLASGSQILEESTRLGEFVRAMDKGLKESADKKITPEIIMKSALASRRVVIDYNRAGEYSRVINKVIAFWNPTIQSTDKTLRYLKLGLSKDPNDRAKFYKALTMSMLTLTIPTMLLYLLNRDDEYYKNEPNWIKDNFFLIPSGEKGVFIRVPKPYGVGLLFSAIPERFLRYMEENDKKEFDELAERMLETFLGLDSTFPYVPLLDAMEPAYEVKTNYSSFFDGPVVPRTEIGLEPYAQFDKSTSELAKTLGYIFDKSPRKIDHLFTGYGAGLAKYALGIIDMGYSAVGKSEKPIFPERFTDYPVVKAFTHDSVKIHGQTTKDFYNQLNRLESEYKTKRKMEGTTLDQFDKASELRKLRWVSQYLSDKRQQISDMQLAKSSNKAINLEILKLTNVVREEMGQMPLSTDAGYDEMAWEYKGKYLSGEFKRDNIKEEPKILAMLGFDASVLNGPRADIYKQIIQVIQSDEYDVETKLELIKSLESTGNTLTENGIERMLKKAIK